MKTAASENEPRRLSPLDHLITRVDDALKSFAGGVAAPERPSPADGEDFDSQILSAEDKTHFAGLMRINHCGEVCAQALYRGQALTAKSEATRAAMQASAREEEDHLAWCESRIHELGGHTSYLNPLWYGLSFSVGALAGAVSDELSLGFVAATEEQVCKHLQEHLQQLADADPASAAVLEQMIDDEAAHADSALEAGGHDFPGVIKQGMTLASQLMTRSTYYI